MIRLCLATDSLEPSGVGQHMLMLAAGLRDTLDVVLACPQSIGGSALIHRAAEAGLGIRKLPDDPVGTTEWLARHGFAGLHIHAGIGWEGHELAAAGRAAGIPVLIRTEHLPDLITDDTQRRQHRIGLALVDRVICVSQASAQSHVAAGVTDPVTIRNGIAPRAAGRTRASVRREFGLDDDIPIVLTAARFTAQKDHATLVAAIPAVLARHPRARFWLAGEGPLQAEVRQAAAHLGIEPAIDLLGHRADVPELLAAADLFVLPSRFEGLPLAVLEAMAAGLAVVATRIGGTEEAVLDGITGHLVPPADPDALADAIGAALADPAGLARLGRAGRKRFLAEFTAERMTASTLGLYRSLGLSTEATAEAGRMNEAKAGRTRLGFVGAGGIANRHLGVLEGFEDVELAAFADPVRDRAVAAAERFGARVYADAEAMLAAERLDALYICVPPFAHGAPERAAIARGLPFFVEKPLALDLDTAEALGREVARSGLVTAVGYHWRYLDTVDEAKALLTDNPAQLFSGYWLDATPPPAWWWKQDQSGGQMIEQTTHIVDLTRYLAGDVTQVFGLAGHTARADFPGLDVATASTASLKFASGAIANLASTCLLRWGHRIGLHVFADGMAIELTDHDIMVDVGRGRPCRHAEGDPVWREDRDFIDAVRGGPNRIRCPYAEALATHRVATAIVRSAASGQPVALSTPPEDASHV